jgi:D-inositol-3-phosphate glycosyltransferase
MVPGVLLESDPALGDYVLPTTQNSHTFVISDSKLGKADPAFSLLATEVKDASFNPDARPATSKRKRIAIIGPAFPFRGGIAHHTNMLSLYLQRRGHKVDLITFTRQYPQLLYPGPSQEETGNVAGFGNQVISQRMIDSINPLNWLQVGKQLRERRYDLYIFKFWLPFFGPAFGTIARLVRRPQENRVLVICDNVVPHEQRIGDFALTRYFFRACDFALCQSTAVQLQLQQFFPRLPSTIQPHPICENFGQGLHKDEARARLGLDDAKILLFFGFIRHYKGLDRLLDAMPEIARRLPQAHLHVVGEFLEPRASYMKLIRDSGVQSHITVHDRYVPNEDVRLWFSAADMVVLPYRSATNSGIAQVAYNFGTPVIVTAVGSLGEIVIDGKTGFTLADASPNSIAGAVEKMYQGNTLERFSQAIHGERHKYRWEAFVEGLEEFAMSNVCRQ